MKPSEIIADARIVLNDVDAVRMTAAEGLSWVNDGIREISAAKPELFSTVATFACVAGAQQKLLFTNAASLIEVLSITGGAALTRFDRGTMDAFRPAWRADTAAAAQQWDVLAGDPLRFLLHPPAIVSQSLDVRYAKVPTPITDASADITELPETYRPALIDYVIYRAELKDDENVLTERSIAMYKAFLSKIGSPAASARA